MKYIASCSFGKDSLAAIIARIERGEQIDGAVYCRIMFDDTTSAELPEHEEWIHNHAIPLLKWGYGINTTVVQSDITYCDWFYREKVKGTRAGTIYGFPRMIGSWCNNILKLSPIRKWKKGAGEYTKIVGIAADETERINRGTVFEKCLPLVDYGITEREAFDLCRNRRLLSPAYDYDRTRLGCWFCHKQRISQLKRIRCEYPYLWEKLLKLDADSPYIFKMEHSVTYYDQRFRTEEVRHDV